MPFLRFNLPDIYNLKFRDIYVYREIGEYVDSVLMSNCTWVYDIFEWIYTKPVS